MNAHIISGLITLAACVLLACRVDKMTRGVTKPAVFWQHAQLAVFLFASAILGFTRFEDWAPASTSTGVLIFFVSSYRRWKHSAPDDTTKPTPLDGPSLHHVAGGKK